MTIFTIKFQNWNFHNRSQTVNTSMTKNIIFIRNDLLFFYSGITVLIVIKKIKRMIKNHEIDKN